MTRKKRYYKVKVTNRDSGRVDIHYGLSRWDLEWLRAMPTLKVDILEVESKDITYEKRDR